MSNRVALVDDDGWNGLRLVEHDHLLCGRWSMTTGTGAGLKFCEISLGSFTTKKSGGRSLDQFGLLLTRFSRMAPRICVMRLSSRRGLRRTWCTPTASARDEIFS